MSEGSASSRPLMRHAVVVSFLTLLSRVTGLFRTILIARFLGTGPASDVFHLAFLLPNLFRRLLGEGSLASSFVPVYAEHCEKGDAREARVFAEKFATLWISCLFVFTVVGIAVMGVVIPLVFRYGSFEDPEKLALTVTVSRIGFWYLVLIGAAAVGQAILSARGVFGPASFAPVVSNLAFIAFAFLFIGGDDPQKDVYGCVFASLAGGLCQGLSLVRALWRLGIRFRPRNPLDHPGVRKVLHRLIPGTLGGGVYYINAFVSAFLASRLPGDGVLTALRNSNLLTEFTLAIFVFGLNTVGLTLLSQHAARADEGAFAGLAQRLCRLVLFITVPSTVGLLLLNRPIITLLFKGGEFDDASVDLTAQAFRFHVLGILFAGLNRVLVSCFHARGNLKTPLRIAAANLVVNLVLAYFLSKGSLAHGGIALAGSLASMVQLVWLAFALRAWFPAIDLRCLVPVAVRTTLAVSAMAVACLGVLELLPGADEGKLDEVVRVFGTMVVGVISFGVAAWVLRTEELKLIFAGLRRK